MILLPRLNCVSINSAWTPSFEDNNRRIEKKTNFDFKESASFESEKICKSDCDQWFQYQNPPRLRLVPSIYPNFIRFQFRNLTSWLLNRPTSKSFQNGNGGELDESDLSNTRCSPAGAAAIVRCLSVDIFTIDMHKSRPCSSLTSLIPIFFELI